MHGLRQSDASIVSTLLTFHAEPNILFRLRLIAVSNISVVTEFLSDMEANCAVGD